MVRPLIPHATAETLPALVSCVAIACSMLDQIPNSKTAVIRPSGSQDVSLCCTSCSSLNAGTQIAVLVTSTKGYLDWQHYRTESKNTSKDCAWLGCVLQSHFVIAVLFAPSRCSARWAARRTRRRPYLPPRCSAGSALILSSVVRPWFRFAATCPPARSRVWSL